MENIEDCLRFLEKKYTCLENYSEEPFNVDDYYYQGEKFAKNLQLISAPIGIIGLLFLIFLFIDVSLTEMLLFSIVIPIFIIYGI